MSLCIHVVFGKPISIRGLLLWSSPDLKKTNHHQVYFLCWGSWLSTKLVTKMKKQSQCNFDSIQLQIKPNLKDLNNVLPPLQVIWWAGDTSIPFNQSFYRQLHPFQMNNYEKWGEEKNNYLQKWDMWSIFCPGSAWSRSIFPQSTPPSTPSYIGQRSSYIGQRS